MTGSTTRHPSSVFPLLPLRVVVFAGLALAGLISGTGQGVQQAAFFLFLASCVLRVVTADRLPVFAAWELGVALIVFGDGLFTIVDEPGIGSQTIDAARRFLVVAACVVQVTYEIVSQHLARQNRRRDNSSRSFASVSSVSMQRSQRALVGLLVMFAYVVWRLAPDAISAARLGRIGQAMVGGEAGERGIFEAVTGPLDRGAAMLLPALWVIWFGPRHRLKAAVVSSPVLLMLLVGTTRYYFLVAVAGLLLTGHRSKRAAILYAGVSAVVLALASWVMSVTRGYGFASGVSAEQWAEGDYQLLGNEGILRTVAQIMDYQGQAGLKYGTSLASVAVFWVPRALWSSKPTLLGHWFPREYGLTGFASNHSVSASFGGDALMDFGFVIGALVVAGFGVAFAYIDLRLPQRAVTSEHWAAIFGCLYGFAYFSARSTVTAIIAGLGLVAAAAVFARLFVQPSGANLMPKHSTTEARAAALDRRSAIDSLDDSSQSRAM